MIIDVWDSIRIGFNSFVTVHDKIIITDPSGNLCPSHIPADRKWTHTFARQCPWCDSRGKHDCPAFDAVYAKARLLGIV